MEYCNENWSITRVNVVLIGKTGTNILLQFANNRHFYLSLCFYVPKIYVESHRSALTFPFEWIYHVFKPIGKKIDISNYGSPDTRLCKHKRQRPYCWRTPKDELQATVQSCVLLNGWGTFVYRISDSPCNVSHR